MSLRREIRNKLKYQNPNLETNTKHESRMVLKVITYRIGSPRRKGEGLRIGVTRLLPRGVRKSEYAKRDFFDVRLPLVAPSRELLKSYTAACSLNRLHWNLATDRD
jgi:hypothetical protein